jgi:hypothetical protein
MCKNRRFGRTYRLHNQVEMNQRARNIVSSLLIPFTLMMEDIRSSETLVLTRAIRGHITENSILHTHTPTRCFYQLTAIVSIIGNNVTTQ